MFFRWEWIFFWLKYLALFSTCIYNRYEYFVLGIMYLTDLFNNSTLHVIKTLSFSHSCAQMRTTYFKYSMLSSIALIFWNKSTVNNKFYQNLRCAKLETQAYCKDTYYLTWYGKIVYVTLVQVKWILNWDNKWVFFLQWRCIIFICMHILGLICIYAMFHRVIV